MKNDWSNCMLLEENSQGATLEGAAALMSVSAREIYTSKLVETAKFCSKVEDGSVHVMGSSGRIFTLSDIMDILCVIGTHNRIARMRGVKLINGGIMLRVTSTSDIGPKVHRVPVMPLADLQRMTRIDDRLLRALISPLVHDGAIKLVVRDQEPDFVGLMVQDGFINDENVKRFFCN